MGHNLHIWLSGIGAALMIAAAPIEAEAQSCRSGLRVAAPVITKQSTQRSIDNVRTGMKQGTGVKDAPESAAKKVQKSDADAKSVGKK